MNVSTRRPAKRGFTLVEVLVTVAIIGVLAALIFPALSKSKDRANAAACASNLRQIGLAFQGYANDHDGELPRAVNAEDYLWPFALWMGQIAPYANVVIPTDNPDLQFKGVYSGIFRCPGKKDWKLNGAGVTDLNRISYAMNGFDPDHDVGILKRLVALGTLSRTLLVADTGRSYPLLPNSDLMYGGTKALRHEKADNVLFCDGHVQRVAKDGMDYDLTLK